MNLFDRICTMPAFLFGVLLLLFAPGLAVARADPLMRLCLAGLCLMAGWGIVRSVWIAWRSQGVDRPVHRAVPALTARDWNMATQAKVDLDKLLGVQNEHA